MAELIRNLRFRDLTLIKQPEALVNTIVAVALAPTKGVWTLVAGVLAGQLDVLIISYILAPHRPRLSFNREAARSLLQFGRWIFMFSLIAVMGSSVLRLFITRELGTAELGLYYLAVSLAFLPSEVASQVVGEVTFPLYARLQSNRAQMSKVFRSMFTGVLAVLMPVCALLIALAPDLVQDVLGSKWEGTAPVIRILALASVISLLGATVVPLFHGIGKPSRVVVLEIVQTTFMLGGFWVFAPRWGLTGVAVAQLFAITTSQFFSAWFTTNLLPRPFLGFLKPLAAIIIISITGAIIAREFNILLPGWVGLFLGSGLAMIGMGWGLWASDRRLELGMVDSLALAFPQMAVFIGQLLTSNR
jgi:PST family polysaccharide transporter